jgi:hypothetical protein
VGPGRGAVAWGLPIPYGGHGNGNETDRAHARLTPGYLSEASNRSHAWAGNASVTPSRSVVSRTMIAPALLAVSTQEPPLASE